MQTPSTILKCVSFIGVKEDGVFSPRATCFYAGMLHEEFSFFYVVTAEHVIRKMLDNKKDIWIRNNKTPDGFSDCHIPIENWYFYPENSVNASDVAVAGVLVGDDDILMIALNGPNEMIADAKAIADYDICIGDEVSVAGLFRNHFGIDRNLPIFRVGNIASLDCGKVKTSYCGYMDAYLIEIRSLGGISGSPVFVNMGFRRRIKGRVKDYVGAAQRLLGLVHGHFEFENAISDSTSEEGRAINVGIAVVTPIDKVMDVVFCKALKDFRDKCSAVWRSRNFKTSQEVIDAVNVGSIPCEQAFPKIVIFSSALV